MQTTVKRFILATLVGGALALGAIPTRAQDQPADNMQIVRDAIHAQKKELIADNMRLTESEAKQQYRQNEAKSAAAAGAAVGAAAERQQQRQQTQAQQQRASQANATASAYNQAYKSCLLGRGYSATP